MPTTEISDSDPAPDLEHADGDPTDADVEADSGDVDEAELDVDEVGGVWLSWPRVIALVAAFAFLGGAVVYFLDSRASSPGEVDVGFYRDMTTHHDQAVEMSLIALDQVQEPGVLTFAEEILIFQNRELGIMATRLEDWGESTSERPPTAMEWMDMPSPVEDMPGMASDDQIDALQAAEGPPADALFLELMAEHHRGGVHMASYAAENAEDAEVRELAGRMARYQAIEVNEMAQTAERLGLDVQIARVEVPPEP